VRTIVDPTVVGLGRYIPRIQRIAEQLPDLNIVVATGCYTYDDVPFFFHHHRGPALNAITGAEVPDPMVDMFVGDIEDGIAGTGVKSALLKCAIDAQPTRSPSAPQEHSGYASASWWTCRPAAHDEKVDRALATVD
jgi:phosphotriesterase-related protein